MKKKLLLTMIFVTGLASNIAKADFVFGEPTNLGSIINSSSRDEEPGISADNLSLYYCSLKSGGQGDYDLWVTTRPTTKDNWGIPVNLGSTVNSSSADFSPDISADGLELYFGSNRPGGSGGYDIWVAKRATIDDNWSRPVNLGSKVNRSSAEGCPAISDDGLELYFWSDRSGGYNIWVARRATTQDNWGTPVRLGSTVNSAALELCMDITADGLSLVFVSGRAGGYGGSLGDMWMSRRSTINDLWEPAINLGSVVNGSTSENGPCLSTDGSMLYFSSDRSGGFGAFDMWQVSIEPLADFNGDDAVDQEDMRIMVEHWGEDYSLCDIGPIPIGDGIVDVEDIKVLAEYLFGDMRCAAHFMLDEARGNIANDSARNRDGTVHGDPEWLPMEGMIGGALQLDGFDDYIKTEFILNPAEDEVSVFAWIKGGAKGEVILSQIGGVNWLCTDPSEGNLMTDLKAPGRAGKPLQSQTNITDGEWHRIGFVWDGSNRTLYVDGIAVAEDAQGNLEGSNNGLYIGCGKTMEEGTFWAGLIDDVRIYNRVVRP